MRGKVVVITGATSGIGQVAAERLAGMGARLVLVGRDRVRGEATLSRVRECGPGLEHRAHYADLSSMAETKRVAAEIVAAEPRVDVLINNAGAMFNDRRETPEGLERTFALNHMSYFLITALLRERLIAAAPARVINTASVAHRRGGAIDFDDLQSTRGYRGLPVYGRTKLCNILYTRELARRLAGTGVTANSLHPGFVATRFGDESGGFFAYVVRAAKLVMAISPEKGAETLVYLAASPEIATISGGYFYQNELARPTREAQDDAAARRLWEASERLAGVSS
ncbi:MAG TPA: SDR family oxidoreductase [Candidatus Nitrosotalea sp.]|jgi:NAD(P)-dependent dehydrogenase (short-subunit alcohol dehydrogenase family)|nr:SDR family oxidoreductase [Candidatus Nitrosotalea sp.]